MPATSSDRPTLWWVPWAVVGTVAVSWARISPGIDAAQKAALIALWLLVIARYGVVRPPRPRLDIVLWLALVLIASSLLITDPLPGLTTVGQANAWAGLVYGLLAFYVPWHYIGVERVARAIMWSPVISVALGLVMQIAGLGPLVRPEFTGVSRLQGASIPAHLAMLCVVAVLAGSFLMLRKQPKATLGTGLAVIILFGTLTRGAIAVAALILLAAIFATQAGRGRRLVAIVGAALAVLWVAPQLELRSSAPGARGFNASGRFEAWDYWIRLAETSPVTGRGFGASVQLSESGGAIGVNREFTVPHQMYLQLWAELGYVGCVVLLVGLALLCRWVGPRAPDDTRRLLKTFVFAVLVYSLVDNTLVTPAFVAPAVMFTAALASRGRNDEPAAHVARVGRTPRIAAPLTRVWAPSGPLRRRDCPDWDCPRFG